MTRCWCGRRSGSPVGPLIPTLRLFLHPVDHPIGVEIPGSIANALADRGPGTGARTGGQGQIPKDREREMP